MLMEFWVIDPLIIAINYHWQIERYFHQSFIVIALFMADIFAKPHKYMSVLITFLFTSFRCHRRRDNLGARKCIFKYFENSAYRNRRYFK